MPWLRPALLIGALGALACGFLEQDHVILYAPALNPAGDSVAYVKRIVDYSLEGGGLFPFLGSDLRVTVRSDRIQLVVRGADGGPERIVEDWRIERFHRDTLGVVRPVLDWHGTRLRYRIRLGRYGDLDLGARRHAWWVLSNVDRHTQLDQGPDTAAGRHVSLSEDPVRVRFPSSNRLVIGSVTGQGDPAREP